MKVLAFAAILFGFVLGQQSCDYRRGGLDLDLTDLIGEKLHFAGNNGYYQYSVCENTLACERNGKTTTDMMTYTPAGVNECLDIADFNSTIRPYFNYAVGAFVFNYTGGFCNEASQTRRSTQVVWNCNVVVTHPFISDVYHYNDCNDYVKIEWEGACVQPPPPSLTCEFKSGLFGGKTLNLSTIQGVILNYTDKYNHEWVFSPCQNKFACVLPNGATILVMSEVKDTSGQCAKILATWSGDDLPFYDRTVFGQDYWDFFWMNGQECEEGGPIEVLNARYYCNTTTPNGNTIVRSAGAAGPPCQFRIVIDSPLAC